MITLAQRHVSHPFTARPQGSAPAARRLDPACRIRARPLRRCARCWPKLWGYADAGTFLIELSVADDDGGVDAASTVVRVVTPAQAVEEIIDLLDEAIANAAHDNVRRHLLRARKALIGSTDHSSDGALNMIRAGNNVAAVAFLEIAIDWLQAAEAEGADVATLIALLEQVAAALTAA
jgi:hypothetical protein